MSARPHPRPWVQAAGLLAALTALTLVVAPSPAQADEPATSFGSGGRIHVISSSTAELPSLTPGDTVVWHLGLRADPPDLGSIQRSLRASGDLAEVPGAVMVEVWTCDQPYTGATCGGTGLRLLDPTPLDLLAERAADLGAQSTDRTAWLAVHVSLAADVGDEAQARSAVLSLAASGTGLGPTTPRSSLPRTGLDLLGPLVAALGAIGTGLALARWATVLERRRRATDTSEAPR